MTLVLDSSATIAWLYAEETTPAIQDVFRRVADEGAWVPGLWRLEVANVLEMGVRGGKWDAGFREQAYADLADLSIRIDPETDRHAWDATTRLASRHRLTLYDAAYLELARRLDVPLATLDGALRQAAAAELVLTLGRVSDV